MSPQISRLALTEYARCFVNRTYIHAIVLLLFPFQASAQCNLMCVQQLQSRGAPPWDVQRNCCVTFPQTPGQLGQRCVSTGGQCSLPQPFPIGSPCYCPTPFGPAGGRVTPRARLIPPDAVGGSASNKVTEPQLQRILGGAPIERAAQQPVADGMAISTLARSLDVALLGVIGA